MIKKTYWLIPSLILGTGIIVGGATAGYIINSKSVFNELRTYTATPTTSSNDGLIQSYLAAAVNGTKLISAPGYTHTSPIIQALAMTESENSSIYKFMNKVGFLLLDDKYGTPIFDGNILSKSAQPIWSTNVASAQFRTDLGSFIVGITLGEFLNEYQYYFAADEDGKLTYATYGGDNFSSVTSFMGGLQKGINFFNKYIVPYSKTPDNKPYLPIEQIFIGEGYQANFAGGFGTTDGDVLINNFLNKKVDALMPVAGDQTTQAVRKIKQQNLRTIVLGVDSASELNTNANQSLSTSGYKEINGSTAIGGTNQIIQFSSLKRLDQMTLEITNNINNNIITPENNSTIGGFGYHSLGNLENNCAGVSEAGYQYFVRAIQLFMASYGLDYNNTDNVSFGSQSNISNETIKSIFSIPNSNPNTNIPTSEEYEKYYSNEYYNKYVQVIMQTEFYQALNLSENKFYEINNSSLVCSYADIPNVGSQMMPLDINELDTWFFESGLATGNMSDDNQKLNSLKQWFASNEETINIRKKFNLHNELNKENWEKNNSIIKVALNAPTVSLLDKSFNESAFDGLIAYWKSKDVEINKP